MLSLSAALQVESLQRAGAPTWAQLLSHGRRAGHGSPLCFHSLAPWWSAAAYPSLWWRHLSVSLLSGSLHVPELFSECPAPAASPEGSTQRQRQHGGKAECLHGSICCWTTVPVSSQTSPELPASHDCRPGVLLAQLLESHLLAENPQRHCPSPFDSCFQAHLHPVLVLHLPTIRHCYHLHMQHISTQGPKLRLPLEHIRQSYTHVQ